MPISIKLFICFIALLYSTSSCNSNSGLKDPRDGQLYQVKKMKDGKIWMTQNLNYQMPDSWCWHDKEENCQEFGRLYTWESAKKACPEGWHLPTDEEWWNLTNQYGKAFSRFYGKSHNGEFRRDLKNNQDGDGHEAATQLMKGGSSGLSLQLGGSRDADGTYYTSDNIGNFWSSSEYKSSQVGWYYHIRRGSAIRRNFGRATKLAYSCRCVKD